MSTRNVFRDLMRERRRWPAGSVDRDYLTRAARQLVWIIRGVPTTEWDARMKDAEK